MMTQQQVSDTKLREQIQELENEIKKRQEELERHHKLIFEKEKELKALKENVNKN